MWAIKLAFAGLGNLIWHWGIGVGLIILILAVEYFLAAVPFVQRFRKDLLWLALGIALFLAGDYVGSKDMAGRCAAKAAVVTEQVDDGVQNAVKTPGLDKWDVNQ
jgi:hypothetical protein